MKLHFMEKILSIIIPTYNMEEYLHKCLDSLLVDQDMDSLDVIIVNDGSTDSSLAIAESYNARFPNVFRVVDKPNGNYGSCINRGLKESKGKYVKVLDADDTFDTGGLRYFMGLLKTVDVDVVFSDYITVGVDDKEQSRTDFAKVFPPREIFDLKEHIVKDKYFWGPMHSICYKTQILRDMNYRQLEGVSYTDLQWGLMPLTQCKKAYYFPYVLYRYLLGREGQTMSDEQRNKSKTHQMKVLVAMAKDTEAIDWDKTKFGSFVYNKFIGQLEFLYKDLLTDAKVKDELVAFDKDLSSYRDVYSFADNLVFQGRFHYVTYWRNHQYKKIMQIRLWFYIAIEQFYVFLYNILNHKNRE